MQISIEIPNAPTRKAKPPYRDADHVVVDGTCPLCAADVFKCIGKIDEQTHTQDTTTAPALTRCCGQRVGKMLVKFSTIFGVEEDNIVLNGRYRVY